MLKDQSPAIEDQTTDRSGAVLTKIASRMSDRKLAALALDTLFDHERKFSKVASFPVDSAKDVLLSRIYFEGQREKIATDQAKAIDERLSTYEALYDLHAKPSFVESGQVKTAQTCYGLLPMCKIASKEELVQAGNDFSAEFGKLDLAERRIFALNFVKAAADLDAELPDEIRLHSLQGTEANPALPEYLHMRKLALDRQGKDSSAFAALHSQISEADITRYTPAGLAKLAEAIDEADAASGLRESGSGKTIPDAWHSVFRIKVAEDTAENTPTESLSKADIVGRYGEGILEEVENKDGEIDQTRLKKILGSLGLADGGKSNA